MKPENLLIGVDNKLKIADFGVANLFDGIASGDKSAGGADVALLRGSGTLTTTEGTFHFMAPECGEGNAIPSYILYILQDHIFISLQTKNFPLMKLIFGQWGYACTVFFSADSRSGLRTRQRFSI